MLGADESEEALEAELLALQGKSPKGKTSSGKGTKVMSMKDIDSMVAGLDEMGEVRIHFFQHKQQLDDISMMFCIAIRVGRKRRKEVKEMMMMVIFLQSSRRLQEKRRRRRLRPLPGQLPHPQNHLPTP